MRLLWSGCADLNCSETVRRGPSGLIAEIKKYVPDDHSPQKSTSLPAVVWNRCAASLTLFLFGIHPPWACVTRR